MAKQNLLLVDADQRSLRVLEVSLRKAGYSVATCSDAATAVEMVELSKPDLILSDTRLPDFDGFTLVEKLREQDETRDIPFLFLSSDGSVESKVRGLQLGVADYLTKPIYIKEIITRVNLELQRRQREGLERKSIETKTRFSGSLSDMGLVDLLQTIDISRKSGVLYLSNGLKRGAIYFLEGSLQHAEIGKLKGESAVYRFLVWNEGDFDLEFRPVRVDQQTIHTSTQGILMEGMRRVDEWGRLLEQLPPLDSVFEVHDGALLERLAEIPDEINDVLKLFDGSRSLMHVVDELADDDLATLSAISKLYFEGLIVDSGVRVGAELPGDPEVEGEAYLASADEEPIDEESGVVPGDDPQAPLSGSFSGLAPAADDEPELAPSERSSANSAGIETNRRDTESSGVPEPYSDATRQPFATHESAARGVEEVNHRELAGAAPRQGFIVGHGFRSENEKVTYRPPPSSAGDRVVGGASGGAFPVEPFGLAADITPHEAPENRAASQEAPSPAPRDGSAVGAMPRDVGVSMGSAPFVEGAGSGPSALDAALTPSSNIAPETDRSVARAVGAPATIDGAPHLGPMPHGSNGSAVASTLGAAFEGAARENEDAFEPDDDDHGLGSGAQSIAETASEVASTGPGLTGWAKSGPVRWSTEEPSAVSETSQAAVRLGVEGSDTEQRFDRAPAELTAAVAPAEPAAVRPGEPPITGPERPGQAVPSAMLEAAAAAAEAHEGSAAVHLSSAELAAPRRTVQASKPHDLPVNSDEDEFFAAAPPEEDDFFAVPEREEPKGPESLPPPPAELSGMLAASFFGKKNNAEAEPAPAAVQTKAEDDEGFDDIVLAISPLSAANARARRVLAGILALGLPLVIGILVYGKVLTPQPALLTPPPAGGEAEPQGPATTSADEAEAPAQPGSVASASATPAPAHAQVAAAPAPPAPTAAGASVAAGMPEAPPPSAHPVAAADEARYHELLHEARNKRAKEAEALLRQAIELNPMGAEAYQELAFHLLARNNNEEARDIARRAILLDATSSKAWITLGAALQALGDRAGAHEAYRGCVDQGQGRYVSNCRRMLR